MRRPSRPNIRIFGQNGQLLNQKSQKAKVEEKSKLVEILKAEYLYLMILHFL